ncbi:YbaB/EbfC family nucleoid-associated protein [Saccharothrix texasensis]|uniref:YbaB/EbfC family nucleoid-associated protein n=1 Tax=Saccharothrix texasensis TaxID=103734 RepID=UPI0011CEB855|nr:YbaB/EbfC family nucleoid-associated protein [Saccharothrix texasensis]
MADGLRGRDSGGVVTVTVDDSADVLAVALAARWKQAVDPRSLGSAVTAAVNAATMQALAKQVERPVADEPPVSPVPRHDGSRITPAEATRLMDAVTADLERFKRQVAEVVDRSVTAGSRGGHVRGTAQRGQVLDIAVDPTWAHTARTSELEQELLEVLRALRARSAPADLAQGPHSPAIAELMALVSDPNTLLRRVGLLP